MSQPPANLRATSKPQLPPPTPKAPFDIDKYLNPFIPRSPLYLLPAWFSRFFGYRAPSKTPPPPPSYQSLRFRFRTLILYTSILVGCFCGVAIIENVFLALPKLSGHSVPIIIASFGAAAILEYNTIESPLAQPRNLVLGHFFSATVAVAITKLFLHLPPNRFDDLRWLAGALAVGAASVAMSATKTVHPPAGATALLAATNVEILELGWWLLPLVLLASMLMLASALVLNNAAGRRFPVYWWTPVDLKALREERRRERKERKKAMDADVDVEKAESSSSDDAPGDVDGEGKKDDEAVLDSDSEAANDLRRSYTRLSRTVSYSSTSRAPRRLSLAQEDALEAESGKKGVKKGEREQKIIITKTEIIVPDWLELNDWEDEVLRILMERLREG